MLLKSRVIISLLCCLFLAGCAKNNFISATKFTSYDDFRAGPEDGVDLVWARIGLRDADRLRNKLQQYDSVILDRVYVLVEDDDSLSDEDISIITTYLTDSLISTISPHKKIVETSTDTTLHLSIAISNVETPNPILAVTSSIVPVSFGISVISKITTGEHTNVGSASIELMVSDENNKPLIAAIDRRTGNKDFGTMIDSLDDTKDVIDWWIKRLGETFQVN
ncbi:DUF3313 domain-containing protein [Moritella sp. F3]|uniref:DUF3313 domain-containing protein n=1 Tax=Moritella sp. F3 TaxID=2718882 RepID=UPI0018E0EC0C|nr:DUF3313 domain-containing protein [Moritella sp. F3]GIC75493.1 hypothetical protein FMO001_02200 [Moritella sp. F1]GIC80638.1 hypothetical protein FMO003_09190 [Moritella sp. F3]